jgi:hypothetical protein
MKFAPKTEAEKILTDKLEKGELVVFCDAGVSLEPPAGLPDWKGLRDESINVIAKKMLEFVPYIRELKTHIPELERNSAEMLGIDIEKEGIPKLEDLREIAENSESFIAELEKIASVLTGMRIYGELPAELVVSKIYKNSENYFTILKSMNAGKPNANHKYIAKLVKPGF